MDSILQLLVLLAAAVSIVFIFKKLRFSPVLGYLVAGALVGPYGFSIFNDVSEMAHIAELGVVLLLFIIGTELSFTQMRAMRTQVFGFGGLQVLITGAVITWVAIMLGQLLEASILIGFGLALSSTALVMQMIQEKRKQESQLGRLSLSVLLMQDLAVVPLLVLAPLLASQDGSISEALQQAGVKAVIAFAVVFIGGRLLLPPVFKMVASLNLSELFSAFTLLLVLGISYGFYAAGLSMALGAFVAGLLVAETEYKHQVEADILPYKGLLLGLFFMVVGMSVDFSFILKEPALVMGLVVALMLSKTVIIVALCRLFKFRLGASLHAGLFLSQGGEFAFILFGVALTEGLLMQETAQLLLLVVAITMALTPFAYTLGEKLDQRGGLPEVPEAVESGVETVDLDNHVVICGYGRVGQTVARLLAAEGISYIALDTDPHIVSACRSQGRSVYYGDVTRREVLNAASLNRASAAVVTVNDFYTANKTIIALKNQAPDVAIIARGNDLDHILKLEKAGAALAISEKYEASLQVGAAVLKKLAIADHEISRITELYRDRDYALTRANEVISLEEEKIKPVISKMKGRDLFFKKIRSVKLSKKAKGSLKG